jgi:secreted trypsin-like serine protease
VPGVQEGYYGVYSKVAYFRDWIDENMGGGACTANTPNGIGTKPPPESESGSENGKYEQNFVARYLIYV